jgi:DNA-binding LacI/PurR family transcriptional regulator
MATTTRKMITRNSVAKKAGVSPAVVSYVINQSNYVSDEKRKAVLSAIEALGYFPNFLARGLKTNKSAQIAVVCDNIDNEWMAKIESFLFERGYCVSILYSRKDPALLRMLIQRQFEGIFMMTNIFSTAELNGLAKNGIPMVLYKTKTYGRLDPKIVTVVPDYYDGVRISVEHLVSKGHKRIAFIPPLKYITKGISGDDFRVRGYAETMAKNHLPLDKRLVCTRTETIETVLETISDMLTKMGPKLKPTAFVVGNDDLAATVMQFVKKMELRVPEDIAVIGADNTYIAEVTSPTLTSMDFQKIEFVQKAAGTLLNLIDGKEVQEEYVKVSLVIRGST